MWKIACMAVALLMCLSGRAEAQFSMRIPSSSTVMEDKEFSLKLDVFSAYPMEMRGLDMQQPKSLTITRDGKVEDLKAMLKPATIIGHQAWRAVYEVKQPGVYQFAMEPAPYFDPEEDRFIIHYTKTVVAAFGDEKGWDVPLGLKMEIIPLTRPFANYSGNIFQGRVLLDGKPVPGAEVEVEYYNRDDVYTTPNVYFKLSFYVQIDLFRVIIFYISICYIKTVIQRSPEIAPCIPLFSGYYSGYPYKLAF